MQYINIGFSFIIVLLAVFLITDRFTVENKILKQYDYIVVGGGTAGCVVAGRLASLSNYSVLLIEAGDHFNFFASIPVAATFFQGTKYDWTFKTEPQKFSSQGMFNQSQSFPRGKGLGGSGQLNYLVHMEPTFNDYKSWSELNLTDWTFPSMNKYFNLMLGRVQVDQQENFGPFMHVSDVESISSTLGDAFTEEATKITNLKTMHPQSTTYNGKRWTSYDGYLKPYLKLPNLHILLNTRVEKIKFVGRRAIGVLTDSISSRRIYVRKEVIISAGAIQSPQILLLSGIGSSQVLKNLNITQIVQLPGVGKNLHDHLNMPLFVSIEKPVSVTANKIQSVTEIWKYVTEQRGLLSSIPIMALGKTNDNIGFILFGMGSTDEEILREIANFSPNTFRGLFPLYKNASQEGFVLLSSCIQPKSRGIVSIKSADYTVSPTIDPRYLENELDFDCIIKGINISRIIIKSPSFQKLGAKIHWPKLPPCEGFKLYSNDYFKCIIRTGALTGYHPGGTCRLSHNKDHNGVVDENLRVKGVNGLRVVDASVLPTPVVQFPNSLIIAIADRAAAIILKNSNISINI